MDTQKVIIYALGNSNGVHDIYLNDKINLYWRKEVLKQLSVE